MYISCRGDLYSLERYSGAKVEPLRMAGKVYKLVLRRGERRSMFPSPFAALAVDPSKCYIVVFSRVALGKDVYIVYKP